MILAGMYEVAPGADPHAKTLLQLLKMDDNIWMAEPVSTVLTIEKNIEGWCKVCKVTLSGPSGDPFGHAKSVCQDHLLADVEATLTNIPCASGYSTHRWRQGTNCMLEKSLGNWQVDKLQRILLFMADFNFLNNNLGRDAL